MISFLLFPANKTELNETMEVKQSVWYKGLLRRDIDTPSMYAIKRGFTEE